MIFDRLEGFANQVALISGARSLTYAELASLADKTISGLPTRGPVALMLERTLPLLITYVGLQRARIPVLLVPETATVEAGLKMARRFGCSHLLGNVHQVGHAAIAVKGQGSVGVTKVAASQMVGDFNPDLAILLGTSGSTSAAKTVRITYRNIAANTQSIVEALGVSADSRAITVLPLTYSYGLSVLHSHLANGASLVVSSLSVTQRAFWEEVDTQRVNSIAGVPATYRAIAKFDDLFSRGIKTATQAGGRLDAKAVQLMAERALRAKAEFYVMYGQTEATARMTVLPTEEALSHPASVGYPVPGGDITVSDRSPTGLTTPTSGEIIYEGPNVAYGYAKDSRDLRLGDDWNGKLFTGDFGYLDSGGRLYVTGRSRDFAKVGGVRVNLAEAESLASGGRGVVAAVAVGDRLVLFMKKNAEWAPDILDLASALGVSPSAIRVRRLESLPETPSGKLDYGTLVELA